MRRTILIVPMALAACATAAPPPASVGPGGRYVCRQASYEEFIGRVASGEVAAELLRASGARTIRWVRPGMAITLEGSGRPPGAAFEYSEERLTVRLASNNRIVTASCG